MKYTLFALTLVSTTLAIPTWAEEPLSPAQHYMQEDANQLETSNTQTTHELAAKIQDEFRKDKLLSPYDIQVQFKDNEIHLQGKVKNDLEYERAITIASSFDNVDDVITDNFEVTESQSILSDIALEAKISGRLLNEKFIEGTDMNLWPIEVEAKNGDVVVTGEVESSTQANNIETTIRDIKGVKSVKADLKIKLDNEPQTTY